MARRYIHNLNNNNTLYTYLFYQSFLTPVNRVCQSMYHNTCMLALNTIKSKFLCSKCASKSYSNTYLLMQRCTTINHQKHKRKVKYVPHNIHNHIEQYLIDCQRSPEQCSTKDKRTENVKCKKCYRHTEYLRTRIHWAHYKICAKPDTHLPVSRNKNWSNPQYHCICRTRSRSAWSIRLCDSKRPVFG